MEAQAAHLARALTDLDDVAIARVVAFGPGEVWYRAGANGIEDIFLAGSRTPRSLWRSVRRHIRDGAWIQSAQQLRTRGHVDAVVEATGHGRGVRADTPPGIVVGLLFAATTDERGISALEPHRTAIDELADVGSAMLGGTFAERAEAAGTRDTLKRIIGDSSFRPVYQRIVGLRRGIHARLRSPDQVRRWRVARATVRRSGRRRPRNRPGDCDPRQDAGPRAGSPG